MIQNEHQYKVSQDKSKEIEEMLEKLEKEKHTLNSRQFAMRKNGLRGILSEIQGEILNYSIKINQ
jgi:HTH-type transcriptional regulator / antitoxin HipB